MALGFTQPLTGIFLRGKALPAGKADSLNAICEQIIYTIRDPHHLNPIGLHGLLRG
jgi:hypothetical protein